MSTSVLLAVEYPYSTQFTSKKELLDTSFTHTTRNTQQNTVVNSREV